MKNAYLVKVEANANNNKFYKMVQVSESLFEVQYGRIGASGFQTYSYSMSKWNSKYNSKVKKGYEDKTSLIAEPTIEEKEKYLQIENNVIKSIVDKLQKMARQAIDKNYTISSSKVTQEMIDEAQSLIDRLSDNELYNLEEFNNILLDLFKTIPRKMSRVSDYLAKCKSDFMELVQSEQDLLDVMRGQVVQKQVDNESDMETPTKTILDAMGLVFEEVDEEDIKLIKQNLGEISNKFKNAWKVKNIKTQNKYDSFIKENNINNTKFLWHGSRNENWWSIINTGLVLRPNAVITGKMFGNGIYFTPKARKSLGYTSLNGSYWVRGNSKIGYMSLYEVAYGTPYNAYSFENRFSRLNYEGLQNLQNNANCLHAHSGKMLRNDEIVVYKEEQMTIKYLVELEN